MAAPKAQNASAASPVATGGALVGPLGTAIPTDATTTVNPAIVALGYVGREGLRPVGSAPSFNDVFAWGGDIVASVLETKSITKYSFTLLEVFNEEVAKLVFGAGNVTVTPATALAGTKLAILDKGAEVPRGAFAFEMAYGGKKMRYVFPDAQLAVTGEGPLTHSDITNYAVEITAYPDSSGVRSYRYLENDNKTA